ncbi:MAG: signal peptidase II [Candidatus Schekmanbacteria bacterium]|nr:signal peptidase II [Candidatus Schekmanbacteria bacterium]
MNKSFWNEYGLKTLFFLSILTFDIASKRAILNSLLLHQSFTVIPNFFDITYVENPGAAFGLLGTIENPWRNLLLGGVSAIAVIMLLNFYLKQAKDNEIIKYAIIIVLAGAIGNLIDRFRFGVVVDFLDFHWYEYHWPAFNVADTVICIGVGLLVWQLWGAED